MIEYVHSRGIYLIKSEESKVTVTRVLEEKDNTFLTLNCVFDDSFVGMYIGFLINEKTEYVLLKGINSPSFSRDEINVSKIRSCIKAEDYNATNGKIALCIMAIVKLAKALKGRLTYRPVPETKNIYWDYKDPMDESALKIQIRYGRFELLVPKLGLSGHINKIDKFVKQFVEVLVTFIFVYTVHS